MTLRDDSWVNKDAQSPYDSPDASPIDGTQLPNDMILMTFSGKRRGGVKMGDYVSVVKDVLDNILGTYPLNIRVLELSSSRVSIQLASIKINRHIDHNKFFRGNSKMMSKVMTGVFSMDDETQSMGVLDNETEVVIRVDMDINDESYSDDMVRYNRIMDRFSMTNTGDGINMRITGVVESLCSLETIYDILAWGRCRETIYLLETRYTIDGNTVTVTLDSPTVPDNVINRLHTDLFTSDISINKSGSGLVIIINGANRCMYVIKYVWDIFSDMMAGGVGVSIDY